MIDNRMLGALAIALAGVLFGFATGRFSAWLVPPSGPASVSSTAKPSVPLQPAAAQKHADSLSKHPLSTSSIADIALDRSKSADSAAAQKPAGSPAEPRQAGAPDDAKLAPDVTSRALSPGELPAGTGRPDARVINSGSADKPEPQEPGTGTAGGNLRMLTASPDALELCRRKFRSFDPTDGTYKPYGYDTRIPCPHLSR